MPALILAANNWLIVGEVFYALTLVAFKISLGLFFIRITTRHTHRYFVYAATAFSSVFGLVFILFIIFACRYNQPGWITSVSEWWGAHCISLDVEIAIAYTHGIVNSATDCVFIAIPLVLLQRSSVSIKDKITVSLILILAGAYAVLPIAVILDHH